MAGLKWDINGKGVDPSSGAGNRYTGPDLPKGSWTAKVKRMTVDKIKSKGENFGKPRINVLLEVTGMTGDKAKYNGAPVWDGLNIIDSSIPFVNGFLHGLTDGSDREKRAVEAAFWDDDKGPRFKKTKVEKGPRAGQVDTHITRIGKYKIDSPNGTTIVQITTKPGRDFKTGEYKPEITGYIPMDESTKAGFGKDDDEDDEDIDDGLGDDDDDLDDDDDVDGSDAEDDDSDDDSDDDDGDEDDDSDSDEDDEDDGDDEDAEDAEDAEPVAAGARKKPPF